MKLFTGIFKGRNGGLDKPLKWWVGVGEDEDPTLGQWLSPCEAKRLANKILKLCEKIEKEK